MLKGALRRALGWREEATRPSPDPFPAATGVASYVPRADFQQALAYLSAKLTETPSWVGICGPPGVGKTLFLRLLLDRCPGLEPVYVPSALFTPSELERWIAAASRAGRAGASRLRNPERPLLLAIDDGDLASPELVEWVTRLCGPSSPARAAIAWSETGASRTPAALVGCATRVFLEPLELSAIGPYVEALLDRAEATPEQRSLFQGDALQRIALASAGNPRAIHRLANAALVAHAWRRRADSPEDGAVFRRR